MGLDELTREYNQKLPLYNSFRERLHSFIRDITQDEPNILAVDSRVKTLPSIAAKATRMSEPVLSAFNDLVGVQVVVYKRESVSKVVERLVKDMKAVESANHRLPYESRYQTIHLTVSIDGQEAELAEWSSFSGLKAEIQIKTAFAAAIDNAMHQSRFDLPSALPMSDKGSHDLGTRIIISALDETIRLHKIVDEFERLIEQPSVHEKRDIHPFLDKHRFILHPNPERIWSEVSIGLGTEHRMDFLIQEADGEFVLTELENPRHRLFLQGGDFSASVNHAHRQVEDWQDWVEDNISTMQKTYPGIMSPRGWVIIGRSRNLSDSQRRKLGRRNINLRGRVKIITYDEIIASARTYIESIRRQLER